MPQRFGNPHLAAKLRAPLSVPVIASPMFIVSTPDLVIAQCKAGVIGSLPALNARPKELLRDWIQQIKQELAAHDAAHPERPAAPFAINQIAHRTNERVEPDMQVIVDEKVPMLIISLAAPAELIGAMHSFGGLVFNDVASARHGLKCAQAGVDGLIAVCAGAGGHTGVQSPFALIPELRQFWDGPLALGGAISSGRAVRAAEVLGADFAYVGTSFIPSHEANAVDGYKDMILASSASDIVMSDRLTGVKANFMRASLEAQGLDVAQMASDAPATKGFGEEGASARAWRDVWSAGHGVGQITKRRSTQDIVQQLVEEYQEADRPKS